MKKIDNQLLTSLLSSIEEAKNKLAALDYATSDSRRSMYSSSYGYNGASVEDEYSKLYLNLYKKLYSCYDQLFFFSLFSDDIRKEAKKIAYENFFAEKFNWKGLGEYPGYEIPLDDDLKSEFMKEIRKNMVEDRKLLSQNLRKQIENSTLDEAKKVLGE